MIFKDIRYAQILIETFLKDFGVNSVRFEIIDNQTVCVVDNYSVSFSPVSAANRSLEKMNIRLVQKVKEEVIDEKKIRKDFYVILDLSVVQKVKAICIENGVSNDFRIDTSTIWNDKAPSISLRYSYWRGLDIDTLNPLLKELGVKLVLSEIDDDDCTMKYTNVLVNL